VTGRQAELLRLAWRILLLVVLLLLLLAAPARAPAQEAPELDWYGYVKLDAAWDESLVSSGNFARWVFSPETFRSHGHFNMTARQTRVGFQARTGLGEVELTGRWEVDFYGGGAENRNSLQVRLAYVEIAWPSGWRVVAGQAPDVISPLVPATLNYTAAWWAGNTGYRRPQLRVERTVELGAGRSLLLQAAAARTIGDDFVEAEPGDAGADSGRPTLQALAGLTLPLGAATVTAGTWFHRGQEHLEEDGVRQEADLATSGWGVYWRVAAGAVSVSGEVWEGSNLDDFLGGVGQGLRLGEYVYTSVASSGGWADVRLRRGPWSLRAGAGLDDPEQSDLLPGYRALNQSGWVAAVRDFGAGLSAGVEVSRWHTEYIGLLDGDSWRVQGSVVFAF
jgi:hypothetical protein